MRIACVIGFIIKLSTPILLFPMGKPDWRITKLLYFLFPRKRKIDKAFIKKDFNAI
jgi:hypothetical protein